MSGEINEAISSMAPQEIKLYKTHPGMQTRSIALLPFDYKVQMDGTTPPYIRSIDGLCREIFGKEE